MENQNNSHKKITVFTIIVLLISMLFFLTSIVYLFIYHKKNKDYKSLYETTYSENKVWRFKDSTWHNRSDVVEISKSDLRNIKELSNLPGQIEGLKNNLRNLEFYSKSSQFTTIHKTIKLKDSVIYDIDSIPIYVKDFEYQDKYDSITGLISKDNIKLDIYHKDVIENVLYFTRRWFLGRKKYSQEMISENPNTVIVYQKSIKAKRRRFKIE